MRSAVFPAIMVIGLLVAGLFTSAPHPSVAQTSTPGATPGTGTPVALQPPSELCSAAELALGESVVRYPSKPPAGSVSPVNVADMKLVITVLTLPPDACIGYRERTGAVVLFVQEGSILYTAHFGPATKILKGDSDGYECVPIMPGCDTIQLTSDASVTVNTHEWVSQDNHAWYTFRNAGDEVAVVSVASYVMPYWGADPCSGGCRTP